MASRLAVLTAAFTLALPPSLQAQANDGDAPIRAFVASFQSAWNARDARGLAALYRSDADQVLGNGAATVGTADIQRQWSASLGALAEGRTNTILVERIRHLGPDVAVVEATGNFSGGRTASGAPIRRSADRALFVLQRDAGAWALASFHVYEAAIEADAASAIRASRDRLVDASLRGDARAAAMVFAADAVNMAPGSPDVRGRDAIQRSYEEFFSGATIDALELTDGRLDVRPFTAYESGTAVQRHHTRDGTAVTRHYRYVATWRREAGGPWECYRFLFNSLPDDG